MEINSYDILDSLVSTINFTHKSIQAEAIRSVSSGLTMRNWIIGYYIVEYEQNGKDRAKYRDKLIENLSKKLSHIKGMSKSNLNYCKQFYVFYSQIFQTVSGKSLEIPIQKLLRCCTFSHFIELMKCEDDIQRTLFYEVETIKGNWSARELKRQIDSATYELGR